MNGLINRRFSGRVSRPLGSHEYLEKITTGTGKSATVTYRLKVVYPLRDNDSNSVAELDVDQFSGQDFMLNANGFISNDIMVFEQSQSDSVARAVLSRLKVLHPQSLPQNMTVDEMMATAIPSNYGSPSEFVSAHKAITEKVYKLHAAELAEYQAKVAASNAAKVSAEVNELDGSVPKGE